MKRTVQKLSAAILTAVMLFSLLPLSALAAASGDYVYAVSNGKAIITEYIGAGGAVTIPSTLGGYPVAGIDDYAFTEASGLTRVVIPSGVTSIGDCAFAYCEDLASITIPNGVTSIGASAFSDCISLTSVALPDSVTSLGDSAFSFSGLTGITLPHGLISIKDWTFSGCMDLASVTIPDNITRIGAYAFALCNLTSITIPGSVTVIGESAFLGNAALASITVDASNTTYASQDGVLFNKAKTLLMQYPVGNTRTSYTTPASVTSIGGSAFSGAESLTSVKITGGVTSIEDGAFASCSRLASITIPSTVTSIGSYAFAECTHLPSIAIPASVTNIGDGAFSGCYGLSAFQVSASNANYASQDGVLFNKAKTRLIQYPNGNGQSTYTVPGSVTRIGEFAFETSKYLTSVTIPGSVTGIEDYAFSSCKNLEKAYFLGNAPTMGEGVFDDGKSSFTVVYVKGKTGFTNPWYGYPTAAYAVPAAPGSFAALSASYSSVKLTWTAVSGAGGYEVYRAASSTGAYTKIATLSGGTTAAYTNTGLTMGSTYYYKVRAYRAMGSSTLYSGYSPVKPAKPLPGTPAVKAASASYTSIKLTWGAVTGAQGYEVSRYDAVTKQYKAIAKVTATSYINTGLTTGTTYNYKVRAYRLAGSTPIYSGYSAVAPGKPLPATPVVKAASASYSSVKVTWGAVTGAQGYEVYRATSSSGAYTRVAIITSGSTVACTDTKLSTGTTYYYKVKACRTVGSTKVYGLLSAAVPAMPVPAAPAGVKAARASATSVKVSWNAVAGASGYEVYVATTSGGAYTLVKGTTALNLTNTGLTTGKTYYYKVKAYRTVSTGKKVYGGYGAVVYAKP